MKNIYRLLPLTVVLFFAGCSSSDDNRQPLHWTKVAAGDRHTLAIRSDGTLWAWGDNYFGQLGDGTFEDRLEPVQVGSDTNWKDVYAGSHHSMALKINGRLWAWGANETGQLGNNSQENSPSPLAIGNAIWNQMALGDLFSVGLQSNGTVWAWGANFWGQVGVSDSPINYLTPQQVGDDTDWVSIATGSHHTLAKKANGSLWGWGSSYIDQLFVVHNALQFSPIEITTTAQHTWTSMSCGDHVLALKPNGKLCGWGSNLFSELGNPAIPDPADLIYLLGNDTWQMVEASPGISTGIKSNGTLWAWGNNSESQLPFGNVSVYNTPTQVGTDSDWKFVTTGMYHGLALKTNNALWSWGQPEYIGNGTATGPGTPVLIPCPQ